MLWRKYVQDLAVMRGVADDGVAASKVQSAPKQVILNLHDALMSQAKGCTKTEPNTYWWNKGKMVRSRDRLLCLAVSSSLLNISLSIVNKIYKRKMIENFTGNVSPIPTYSVLAFFLFSCNVKSELVSLSDLLNRPSGHRKFWGVVHTL